MNEYNQFNEKRADQIITALEKRNMKGYYCSTKEEATQLALSMIHNNATVSWGGSKSLDDIGIIEELRNGDYDLLDSSAVGYDQVFEIYHKALSSDHYLMGTNAITMDGQLVNIDGFGNRISSLIFGPKNVIVIAGMNKVERDLDSAMKRARNQAAPINSMRLNMNTPCTKTGRCHDCLAPDTICGHILTTRVSKVPGRINVILVGDNIGY